MGKVKFEKLREIGCLSANDCSLQFNRKRQTYQRTNYTSAHCPWQAGMLDNRKRHVLFLQELTGGPVWVCRSVNPLHLPKNSSIRQAVCRYLHSICPEIDCGKGYIACWSPDAAQKAQIPQSLLPCLETCLRTQRDLLLCNTESDFQRNLPHP